MSNETALTIISQDGNLIYDKGGVKETYSLAAIPPESAMLIGQAKEDISQGLQIGSIVTNLDNAAGLMFVAYNALGGTTVQAEMTGLQKKLLNLCDDSLVSITRFQGKSQEITGHVIKAYDWLIKGKEQVAMKQFDRCADCAKDMAKESEKLAGGFKEISDQATSVLQSTERESASKYQEMDRLKKEHQELEAKLARQATLQEELNDSLAEIETIYMEAKEQEKRELDRQSKLQLAGIITSGLTGMVSLINPVAALVSSNSKGGDKEDKALAELQKETEQKQSELSKKEEEVQAAEEEKAQKEQQAQTLEQEITALQEKQEAAKEVLGNADEGEKAEAQKMMEDLKTELVTKQVKLETVQEEKVKAEKKAIDLTKEVQALQQAFSNATDRLDKMASQAQSAADKYSDEKRDALEKKMQMEKERRECLSSIQEFTKMIEASVDQQNTAATAVETLHMAIVCLKQVVTSLSNAALFWRSLEQYCRSLASNALLENMQDIMDAYEPEERIAVYKEPDFMDSMLQYLVKWAALYYVCVEYLSGTRKVRGKVEDNILAAPKREEGWAAAKVLAQQMNDEIGQQILEADQVIGVLERVE